VYTHQALTVNTHVVAAAVVVAAHSSHAPGAVDHVTEVVAEAISDGGADQLTLIVTWARVIYTVNGSIYGGSQVSARPAVRPAATRVTSRSSRF